MGQTFRHLGFAGLIAAAGAFCSIGSAPAAPLFPLMAPAAASQSVMEEPADDAAAEIPANLRRQVVNYPTREAAGTIVVDTANTYLYLVLGGGKAIRYGIGVGREGFTWSGVKAIERKAEWPDWHPPAEMIERQPYLPRFTAGGPGNPLGARAMYLGGTVYRIHGTNNPATIGHRVSSGCIRLTNDDVTDLYERAQVGAKVIVLPQTAQAAPAGAPDTNITSYAPMPAPSRAATTWAAIRPSSLY